MEFRAIVFRPFKNEVLDGVVTQMDQFGIFVEVGPLQVYVSDQVPVAPPLLSTVTIILLRSIFSRHHPRYSIHSVCAQQIPSDYTLNTDLQPHWAYEHNEDPELKITIDTEVILCDVYPHGSFC